MDLAKVGEVQVFCGVEPVNGRLAEGWVLLSLKIVEEQRFNSQMNMFTRHADVWYVLGKPREKPKPLEL